MVFSASARSVPWHDRPARPFPAKDWLEERYRFRILTPLARLAVRPAGWATSEPRKFPAKKWLEERQAGA